jgi:hypothetical protein
MKRIIIIAILAVLAKFTANAQTPETLRNTWQKTINVPESQASIIEKLFTAWGKVFPGDYVDTFDEYKGNPTWYTNGQGPYLVDFAPKNGYLSLTATVQMDLTLTAVYWNLQNGNKLFGVSVNECYQCEECGEENDYAKCEFALAFYEYDAKKGTMTPRPEITKKVLDITNYVRLPKEGRDLSYYDNKTKTEKSIKWNGNGF